MRFLHARRAYVPAATTLYLKTQETFPEQILLPSLACNEFLDYARRLQSM
jgi:hypothetical protein